MSSRSAQVSGLAARSSYAAAAASSLRPPPLSSAVNRGNAVRNDQTAAPVESPVRPRVTTGPPVPNNVQARATNVPLSLPSSSRGQSSGFMGPTFAQPNVAAQRHPPPSFPPGLQPTGAAQRRPAPACPPGLPRKGALQPRAGPPAAPTTQPVLSQAEETRILVATLRAQGLKCPMKTLETRARGLVTHIPFDKGQYSVVQQALEELKPERDAQCAAMKPQRASFPQVAGFDQTNPFASAQGHGFFPAAPMTAYGPMVPTLPQQDYTFLPAAHNIYQAVQTTQGYEQAVLAVQCSTPSLTSSMSNNASASDLGADLDADLDADRGGYYDPEEDYREMVLAPIEEFNEDLDPDQWIWAEMRDNIQSGAMLHPRERAMMRGLEYDLDWDRVWSLFLDGRVALGEVLSWLTASPV